MFRRQDSETIRLLPKLVATPSSRYLSASAVSVCQQEERMTNPLCAVRFRRNNRSDVALMESLWPVLVGATKGHGLPFFLWTVRVDRELCPWARQLRMKPNWPERFARLAEVSEKGLWRVGACGRQLPVPSRFLAAHALLLGRSALLGAVLIHASGRAFQRLLHLNGTQGSGGPKSERHLFQNRGHRARGQGRQSMAA